MMRKFGINKGAGVYIGQILFAFVDEFKQGVPDFIVPLREDQQGVSKIFSISANGQSCTLTTNLLQAIYSRTLVGITIW